MNKYLEFWRYFLKKAEKVIPLYQDVSPKNKNYLVTNEGEFFDFNVAFREKDHIIWVEKCFQEKGDDGVDKSNKKFDHFFNKKNVIENEYGGKLEWLRLSENKRSRILSENVYFDIDNKSSRDKAINEILEKMSRFIPAIEREAEGYDDFTDERESKHSSGSGLSVSDGYTPNDADYEFALRQLAEPGTDISISKVEDQIEKNMAERNKHLAPNWRKSKK